NGTVKSQVKDEVSLYNHYKKLLMLRKANPEIARGTYTILDFTNYTTFGGFLSTYQDSTVGIFHNVGDSDVTVDLSNYTTFTLSTIQGFVGEGIASLNGQILTISGNTSAVLK
ncbi:MAG: hypothetical protein KAH13_05650, partial [Tenericutes bacterium]|nr:hypothetical protein [Mycoplasmatota bacterium]